MNKKLKVTIITLLSIIVFFITIVILINLPHNSNNILA